MNFLIICENVSETKAFWFLGLGFESSVHLSILEFLTTYWSPSRTLNQISVSTTSLLFGNFCHCVVRGLFPRKQKTNVHSVSSRTHNQGGNEESRGAQYRDKSQQCRKYFFNTVHLLPKDLRIEHRGAKFVSCPGRHLTSVRPCRPAHNIILRCVSFLIDRAIKHLTSKQHST